MIFIVYLDTMPIYPLDAIAVAIFVNRIDDYFPTAA